MELEQDLKHTEKDIVAPNAAELAEEQKRLRRLQFMLNMVMQTFTHARLITVL